MSKTQIVYDQLNSVLPNKVFYGTNRVDDTDDVYPFIVYQEVSNRAVVFADNATTIRQLTIQITLVTERKDPTIEVHLEEALSFAGYIYQMVTEYLNEDGSINRVYEIKMED